MAIQSTDSTLQSSFRRFGLQPRRSPTAFVAAVPSGKPGTAGTRNNSCRHVLALRNIESSEKLENPQSSLEPLEGSCSFEGGAAEGVGSDGAVPELKVPPATVGSVQMTCAQAFARGRPFEAAKRTAAQFLDSSWCNMHECSSALSCGALRE